MPSYANLKILAKILMLLGVLSLVSLAAVFFATSKMKYIDATYADLINGPGKANLAIARANRNLVYVNRSIYRLLSEVTEDGRSQAMDEITDTQGYFNKQVEIAINGMPAKKEAILKVQGSFTSIMAGACAETIKLGNSDNEEERKKAPTQMREVCDPALHTVMDSISSLTKKIIDDNDEASKDAIAVTKTTVTRTYIFVLSGLFVVLLLSCSPSSRPRTEVN